jgi:hypothetical protein
MSPATVPDPEQEYHARSGVLAGWRASTVDRAAGWRSTPWPGCGREGAQRRYDSWQPTYNAATKRMEQRIVTTWRRLPVSGDWQRTYAGEEPGMQARAPAAPSPLSE